MRRMPWGGCVALLALALALLPGSAGAQRLERVVIGGGLGVAGGVGITMAAITARARFMDEYLHEPADLIHWQSAPMIAAPAAGVAFGLMGEEALVGSVVGSVSGLVIGAGVGAGWGWLASRDPELPWAGGVIGGGVGMTVGGLTGGLLAWRRAERHVDAGEPPPPPVDVVLLRIRL